jgi:hypothetical protein
MRRSLLLAALLAPSPACIAVPPPAAPAPVAPATLELRLAPEDRALLERLVTGLASDARGNVPTPAPATLEARRPSVPRDTRNRLVTDGPVTLATYTSGRTMFEGAQIEGPDGWQRHGPWRAWHPEGQPWEEGAYDRERPHGPWRWWYEDGTLQAEGAFELGLRVGEWVYYHPNGKPWAEGRHADDRAVGLWRVYDESGALLSEIDHGE